LLVFSFPLRHQWWRSQQAASLSHFGSDYAGLWTTHPTLAGGAE
jgi:hypothetical protein